MFETQFTLWLQSFSNPILDTFFLALSWLGYEQFIQAFLVFVIFGINIRYGFILSQAIIWTAAITEVCKLLFHYPRPFMVDNRIVPIGQPDIAPSPLFDAGAPSFWSGLSSQTLGIARQVFVSYPGSWGIPSGHTAGAIVIWGSLMHWFKRGWLWSFGLFFIVFIPLSRLYLGMHFLADIFIGYLIGAVVLIFFVKGFFNRQIINAWLFSGKRQKLLSRQSALFILFFVLPGCAALFSSTTPNDSITLILGANAGFYGVWLRGVPIAIRTLKLGVLRLLIAYALLSLMLIVDFLTDPWLLKQLGSLGSGVQEIVLNALFVYGGIELLVKLGFLKRQLTESCAKASQ